MVAWFAALDPKIQGLLAGLFTWTLTAMGAAAVFWTSQVHRKLLDAMLGFSGGVMLAASYWSLLAPAIEISEHGPLPTWFPPMIGFLLGGGVLWLFDRLLPHLHLVLHWKRRKVPKLRSVEPFYWSRPLPCTTFRKGSPSVSRSGA